MPRLLFDGVDAEACTPAVGGQNHLAVDILADEAKTPVTIFEGAATWAQVADDASIVLAMPPAANLRAIAA
jgi:hypothetical protein